MPESTIGFYGHVKQYHNLKAEIDQAILDVLESGSYVLGPQLVKFEEELARYMKTKETVGVNSGTDALWLVFLALGLGPGDEIITTSNTFFATAEAIWLAGATPVFVDSDPKTRNIDVNQDRSRDHAEDPRHRARASVRPHRGHACDRANCQSPQSVCGGRLRPGHRCARRQLCHRRAQRRSLPELHHPEEPGMLRGRRRRGHQ